VHSKHLFTYLLTKNVTVTFFLDLQKKRKNVLSNYACGFTLVVVAGLVVVVAAAVVVLTTCSLDSSRIGPMIGENETLSPCRELPSPLRLRAPLLPDPDEKDRTFSSTACTAHRARDSKKVSK